MLCNAALISIAIEAILIVQGNRHNRASGCLCLALFSFPPLLAAILPPFVLPTLGMPRIRPYLFNNFVSI